MAQINFVTLKNRSSKTLTGQFDGKSYNFPPGYEGKWAENIALKFKEQNPVMGSEDWFSGYKQYLMGIVEHGDDLEPVEQTGSKMAWDQSTVMLPPGTQLAIVKGRGYHPVQDRGNPAPPIADPSGQRVVQVESFEPDASGIGSDRIQVVDAIDNKP